MRACHKGRGLCDNRGTGGVHSASSIALVSTACKQKTTRGRYSFRRYGGGGFAATVGYVRLGRWSASAADSALEVDACQILGAAPSGLSELAQALVITRSQANEKRSHLVVLPGGFDQYSTRPLAQTRETRKTRLVI